MINFKSTLLTLFVIVLFSCQSGNDGKKTIPEGTKTSANDPFKNTMVESQYFDLDTKQDNVVEGKNGTVLFIPKGAFLDKNGKVIEEKVTLEFAQPNSLSDIILSNLTTTANGKPMSSGGMFFVSAKAKGEIVNINPDNPLYAESVSDAERGDMMLYYGERDEKGVMNWIDPKPLEKWLVPVELELLNFYPKGFEEQVEMGMPFRNYTVATKELKDSLYYSLAVHDIVDYITEERNGFSSDSTVSVSNCKYINPASIKVLRNKRFQNTLISTREFEKRLKIIFGTCNQKVLDLYATNLDKNLWEIDSMAMEMLGTAHPLYSKFKDFSAEKLTKVQNSNASAGMSAFYNRKVKETEKKLLEAKREYERLLQRKDKEAQKKREEYSGLLEERLIYRLEKFGYKIDKNGYYSIYEVIKDLEKFELKVKVDNLKTYDRAHVYIVNPIIKSLFAMVQGPDSTFDRGYMEDNILLMWKEQKAIALVVAYKGDQAYYDVKDFSVTNKVDLTMNPKAVSKEGLKEALNNFKRYTKENKITLDLEYQDFFYREKKRKEQLHKEDLFIQGLYNIVKGDCCENDIAIGKTLFEDNCSACHCKSERMVGPALQDISKRRPVAWVMSFTRNSAKMIAEGDPVAIRLFDENAKVSMTTFPGFTDQELLNIIAYLDSKEKDGCRGK